MFDMVCSPVCVPRDDESLVRVGCRSVDISLYYRYIREIEIISNLPEPYKARK